MSLLYSNRASSSSSIAHGPSQYYDANEYEIDFETAALIAKLSLEDIESVEKTRKGKSRSDAPISDEEYAMRLQYESFNDALTVSQDAKIANSMRDALRMDNLYLEALVIAEQAAASDRRAAQMLQRGESLPPPNAAQKRVEKRDFRMHPEPPVVPKPAPSASYVEDDISDTESVIGAFDLAEVKKSNLKTPEEFPLDSGSKKRGVVRRVAFVNVPAGPSVNRNRSVSCTICTDKVRYINALHTLCDHHYCVACTISLIENVVKDETLFPLKCCQTPIPMLEVIPLIPDQLLEAYKEKQVEYKVPPNYRVYCISSTCSTFLGSAEGRSTHDRNLVCHKCAVPTCTKCKGEAHAEADCAVHAAGVMLRKLALESKWQTCAGCKAIVEKNQGCNHITCRCGAQFCYICSKTWKTCGCPKY